MAPSTAGKRRAWMWAAATAGVVAAGATVLVLSLSPSEEPEPVSVAVAPPSPPVPPTPTPETELYPEDAGEYDVATLPAAQVYSVIPELPLDSEPHADVSGTVATPRADAAPVFAEPGTRPVAQLPRSQTHDGTTVPVIEEHTHWVKVLLPNRSGLPSQGVVGQTVGWLRTADVDLAENPFRVTVSLANQTVTIHEGDEVRLSTEGFGFGVPSTPTPIGRTFIMTVFTDPNAGYTRGNPTTALAVQSPTLDGFGGTSVAVTAFHYHDVRSGPVSNGCVRVDAATSQQLAALPLGTPVLITE